MWSSFYPRFSILLFALLLSLSGCQCEKGSNIPVAQRTARVAPQWLQESTVARIEIVKGHRENIFEKVEQKLQGLHSAGFTTMWLSTVVSTSTLYREYGPTEPAPVQDFLTVDSDLGTLDDFKKLVNAAHTIGLKLIVDLPMRYTAWDSKIVQEHPDWFHTNENGAITAPNVEWSDVADLNYEHHELRKYMIGALKFWIDDIGLDGLAFHKAELVPLDFWERARSEVLRDTHAVFLAQSSMPEHYLEAFDAAYSNDGGAPATERGEIPASIAQSIAAEKSMFPQGALRMRFSNVISDNPHQEDPNTRVDALKNISTVLAYTLPGIPVAVFDTRWLHSTTSSPSPVLSRLNEFRREFQAAEGEISARQLSEQASLIAYERKFDGTRLLVLLNYANDEQRIRLQLPEQFDGGFVEYLSKSSLTPNSGSLEFIVEPMGAQVLIRTNKGTAQ